jgi:hypothetical protein
MSKGNPLSSQPSKHSIHIYMDDATFKGLGSTNVLDFKALVRSDMRQRIFGSATLTANSTPFDYIKILKPNIKYSYTRFDVTSKTYNRVIISEADILNLIAYHEKNEETGESDPPQSRKTIRDIQNSLHGYIAGTTSSDGSGEVFASVHFLKSDKSNGRKIIPSNIPIISDYPRTDAGTKYSFRATLNHQQSGVNGENIGVYKKTDGNTDSPSDKVAAPLRLSYDRSNGTWGVANQMLVVAAENIESANIRPLDEVDSLLNGALNPDDFSVGSVDQKPQKGIGNFTTGKGVVFSPERGNPHMFTPNFIQCSSGERPVETIRITNRTNGTIKKGSLLMCNYINGEWIPTVIRESDEVKTAANKWSFSQFIVSSDFFFKDNRFYSQRPLAQGGFGSTASIDEGNAIYSKSILDIYKSKVRLKYFTDWAEAGMLHEPQYNLVKANWYPNDSNFESRPDYTANDWNLDIPEGYFQFSNFDFVSDKLGGQCAGTIIGRTNIDHGEPVYRLVSETYRGDKEPVGYDLPFFWGAVLTDGYVETETQRLRSGTIPYSGIGPMVKSTGNIDIYNDTIIAREWAVQSLAGDGTLTGSIGLGLFADSSDPNFKQLPADIATHASPSGKYGAPIKIPKIKTDLRSLNVFQNLYPDLSYLTSQSGEVFDLKPANSNIIQFTPLSYHTLALDRGSRFGQGNWNHRGSSTSGYYRVGGGIDPDRRTNPADLMVLPNNPAAFIYDAARDFILEANRNTRIWPERYDQVGGSGLWRPLNPFLRSNTVLAAEEPWDGFWSSKGRGANMVGITGASCTVSLGGRKELPISTIQMLGIGKKAVSGGGGGISFSSVAQGFATAGLSVSQAPVGATRSLSQWGNNDAQDSLGGAVLYLQAYEAWPESDKWFDARYNAVFHFNPPSNSGIPQTTVLYSGIAPPSSNPIPSGYTNGILTQNFRRTVDQITSSVEHRVPSTYNHGANSHEVMAIGTVVTSGTLMAPPNEWKVERCRNRKLLPFVYEKLVIGLTTTGSSIANAGSGFTVNEQITASKGVKVKITSVGNNGSIAGFSLLDAGEGFLPSDFAGNGFELKMKNAILKFTSGIVLSKITKDSGPQRLVQPMLISTPSKFGENANLKEKDTVIAIPDGAKTNSLDLFFWFQNDVSYTPMFYRTNQYIKVILQ